MLDDPAADDVFLAVVGSVLFGVYALVPFGISSMLGLRCSFFFWPVHPPQLSSSSSSVSTCVAGLFLFCCGTGGGGGGGGFCKKGFLKKGFGGNKGGGQRGGGSGGKSDGKSDGSFGLPFGAGGCCCFALVFAAAAEAATSRIACLSGFVGCGGAGFFAVACSSSLLLERFAPLMLTPASVHVVCTEMDLCCFR